MLLEQSHPCQDYLANISIGYATWRPLRDRLTRGPEKDDTRNRLTHQEATLSSIVTFIGGLLVVYSNEEYLRGIIEARQRRNPSDTPQIVAIGLIEGADRLT